MRESFAKADAGLPCRTSHSRYLLFCLPTPALSRPCLSAAIASSILSSGLRRTSHRRLLRKSGSRKNESRNSRHSVEGLPLLHRLRRRLLSVPGWFVTAGG